MKSMEEGSAASRRVGIEGCGLEHLAAIRAEREDRARRDAETLIANDLCRQEAVYSYHYRTPAEATGLASPVHPEPSPATTGKESAGGFSDLEVRYALFSDLTYLFRVCVVAQRVSRRLENARRTRVGREARLSGPLERRVSQRSATPPTFAATLSCFTFSAGADEGGLPPCALTRRAPPSAAPRPLAESSGVPSNAAKANGEGAGAAELFKVFDSSFHRARRMPLWSRQMHLGDVGFPLFALHVAKEAADELEVLRRRGGRATTNAQVVGGESTELGDLADGSCVIDASAQPPVTLETYFSGFSLKLPHHPDLKALCKGAVAQVRPVALLDDVHHPHQATFAAAVPGNAADRTNEYASFRFGKAGDLASAGKLVALFNGGAPQPPPPAMSCTYAVEVSSSDSELDDDPQEHTRERLGSRCEAGFERCVKDYDSQWALRSVRYDGGAADPGKASLVPSASQDISRPPNLFDAFVEKFRL